MATTRLLSILVPAYNEEEYLATSILRALEAPLPEGLTSEVVAVDDGSTDCTPQILDELAAQYPGRIRVFHHKVNAGKGAAIRTALENAAGEFGIIQDGDLEYDPSEYPKVLGPLLALMQIRPDLDLIADFAVAGQIARFEISAGNPPGRLELCREIFRHFPTVH